MRGGWGALLQKKLDRNELRLILPFNLLRWSGQRRYLPKDKINDLAQAIADAIILPERFTENERDDFLSVLQNASAIWCLDSGDSFASMYAALANEQAWERAQQQNDKLLVWWQGLAEQERSEALGFINQLWPGAALDDKTAAKEFFALAASLNTRWSEAALLSVNLSPRLIKLASNEMFKPGSLSRPKLDITSATIAQAFSEDKNGDFAQSAQASLDLLGHLSTGPKSLSLFGANSVQLSEMVKKSFAAALETLPLTDFKSRLITEYKLASQAKGKLDELIAGIDIKSWLLEGKPKVEIAPQIRLHLSEQIIPPVYAANILYKLSYLPAELSEQALGLIQNYLNGLKQLWYMWYILLDNLRQSLTDFIWLNKVAEMTPLWDLKPKEAILYLQNHIGTLLSKEITLPVEIEIIVGSANWLLRHDGEVPKQSLYSDDYFAKCAAALEESPVSIGDASQTVKDLLSGYWVYSTKKRRGAFERLQFIRELNLSGPDKDKCLKILDWYDELKLKQENYDEELKAWQEIEEYMEENQTAEAEMEETKQTGNVVTQNPPNPPEIIQTKPESNIAPALDTKVEAPIVRIEEPLPVKSVGQVINSSQFLHPVPQSFKAAKPALVFDIEDEKEADKYRSKSKSKSSEEGVIFEKQLRAFVTEVIKKNNLAFKDEVNQRRFIQLMVSRLKDVRGPLEIAEALRKPVETGGLGMPDEKAEQVQALVEAAKQEFESRIKNPEPRGVQGPAPDVVPGQESKPAGSPPVPGVASSGQEPGTRNEPAPRFDVEAAKAWREQMLRDLAMQGQAAATESPAVPRPQLMDVKAPPRVVGPLEELRSLTLTDFRRLGATPPEALQKIHAKIDLLGETSLARRLEAVRAWKTSAVYQQYLKVGHESIEQGKPVSVIVGGHQTLGEQILTEEEFSSIADFNAKLRF